jgi:acyl-CoA hydrolase
MSGTFDHELTLAQVMLPDDANPRGNVHGGTLMKLADSAGGVYVSRGRLMVT